jgi:hypothetical protein
LNSDSNLNRAGQPPFMFANARAAGDAAGALAFEAQTVAPA